MHESFSRPFNAGLPEHARHIIGRYFFGAMLAAALVSAAILLFLAPGLPTGWQAGLVGSVALFALFSGAAMRYSARPAFPTKLAMSGAALIVMLLAGLIATLIGEGLRSPLFGFCALVICVVGASAGGRYGVALALAAGLGEAALAWAESTGMIAVAVAASPTPMLVVLLYQWLLLACGAFGGDQLSRLLAHYLYAAAEREQRFQGLLRIAADWYWEQDDEFRFTAIGRTNAAARTPVPSRPLHHTPWEIDDIGLTDEQLDEHRADLESHRPFHSLLARRRDATGRWRTTSISGEPKFSANGLFQGYWGVARDVSDEVRVQRAVTASETRYRELFTRSPSPLFLHRRGIVFDANEAAARLFGFDSAAEMNGYEITGLFAPGDQRDLAIERIARLEGLPVGAGIAVADHHMHSIDGRPLIVQATGVRVETSTGTASLSILFDITARQAVEAALRRSEAMLSHLFATSPDCITLTEMVTDRYAMVNPSFYRRFGFGPNEVIGQRSTDLKIWNEPADRGRLLAQLERDGTVLAMPMVFVTRFGERVSMLVAAGRFVMDRRQYLVLNCHDVTETERTRLQHTAILERASIGIAFTRDGRFVQANPYFERMFGWDPGALPGQTESAIWPDDEAYRDVGEQAAPLLGTGKPFEAERRMRRRDGGEFWCRLLAQAVDRGAPIRGGTIWIAEDVTERRRLDAALAAARDAAEAASRAKSAFLANTSHEIRTPLNGLLGLARLAMRHDLDEALRGRYLAQILDSAQSLADIMSDVLDVSKIEAGKLVLEDTTFDLHATLTAVHHAYESLAEVKGLALTLQIGAGLPATVRGDPVRVRQILSNFIANALKFTDRGQVRIDAGATPGGDVRLAVSDTGPGVDAKTLPLLFTPFLQGDSSTTRRFGGTGLGLSICRDLARLMGGTVGVDSVEGRGSTFWTRLPLPPADPVATASGDEARELQQLRGAYVLMAEDNPVNMMIAVAMLELWGVRVAQACDGRAAVEAVDAAARTGQPFDAVLMDMQMPVMGGHEATRELRSRYSSSELPIIALTAAALVSEREDALRAGMDDFLTKPIDAPKLRRTLAHRIGTRQQRISDPVNRP